MCTITLSSPVGPNISALSVTWQHNETVNANGMTQPANGVNSKIFMKSLTLQDITISDSGQYCCQVEIIGTSHGETSNCTTVIVAGKAMAIALYVRTLILTLSSLNRSPNLRKS